MLPPGTKTNVTLSTRTILLYRHLAFYLPKVIYFDIMELSPNAESVDKKPILTADGLIQTNTQEAAPNNTSTGNLTASRLDVEILPVIYDIIRCVEKDPKDNSAKQRESQECCQKILELQKRFESARAQVRLLPGIDYNKEEQLQKLELLKNQLKLKQQLIRKYKDKQF